MFGKIDEEPEALEELVRFYGAPPPKLEIDNHAPALLSLPDPAFDPVQQDKIAG